MHHYVIFAVHPSIFAMAGSHEINDSCRHGQRFGMTSSRHEHNILDWMVDAAFWTIAGRFLSFEISALALPAGVQAPLPYMTLGFRQNTI